jgi:hypothetical protein
MEEVPSVRLSGLRLGDRDRRANKDGDRLRLGPSFRAARPRSDDAAHLGDPGSVFVQETEAPSARMP